MEELLKIINSVKEANKSKDSKSLKVFDNQRGGGGKGSTRWGKKLNDGQEGSDLNKSKNFNEIVNEYEKRQNQIDQLLKERKDHFKLMKGQPSAKGSALTKQIDELRNKQKEFRRTNKQYSTDSTTIIDSDMTTNNSTDSTTIIDSDMTTNNSTDSTGSESNVINSSDSSLIGVPLKRGPGRPRKYPIENQENSTTKTIVKSPKRKIQESEDSDEEYTDSVDSIDLSKNIDTSVRRSTRQSKNPIKSPKRKIQESEDSDESSNDLTETGTSEDSEDEDEDEDDDDDDDEDELNWESETESTSSEEDFAKIEKNRFSGKKQKTEDKLHNVDYKTKEKIYINDKIVEYLKNSNIKNPRALILEDLELNTTKVLHKFDPGMKIIIPQIDPRTSFDIIKKLRKDLDDPLKIQALLSNPSEILEQYPYDGLDPDLINELYIEYIKYKVKMPDVLFMDFTATYWGIENSDRSIQKTVHTMLELNNNPELIFAFTVSFARQRKKKYGKYTYTEDMHNIMKDIVEKCIMYSWKIDKFQVYKYHRTTIKGGKTENMIFDILQLKKSENNIEDLRILNEKWLKDPIIIGDVNEEVGTLKRPKLL